MIKNVMTVLKAFFFRQESTEVLGLFRIGVGLLAFSRAFLLLNEFEHWYGPNALVGPSSRSVFGIPIVAIARDASPVVAEAVLIGLAVSGLALTFGFMSRASSFLVYLFLATILKEYSTRNMGDVTLLTLAFYLMLTPSGRSLSVDARLSGQPHTYSPWPIRLLQIQISLMYVGATISKLLKPEWVSEGTAIYYFLNYDELKHFYIPDYLRQSLWVSYFLTWGTLVVEFCLGLFVWISRFRYPVLIAGIIFHLSLEYAIYLELFPATMIVSYLVFVRPNDLARWVTNLRRPRTERQGI